MVDTTAEARCGFQCQEFSSLMSYLPNLQEIDLEDCKRRNIYMDYLRDLDSSLFLTRLERIESRGGEIYGQSLYSHFTTYYNFRSTLTHVALNYSAKAAVI